MITLLKDISYVIKETESSIIIAFEDKTSLAHDFRLEFSLDLSFRQIWQADVDTLLPQLLSCLSDSIINQPYVDMQDYAKQVDDVTIYHANHDTAHALRRFTYCRFLMQAAQVCDRPFLNEAIAQLTPEADVAIQLASFLQRCGRSNERDSKSDDSNTIRSARIFAVIAMALGFSDHLIDMISLAIAYYAPVYQSKFQTRFPNYEADKLAILTKALLDVSHDSDLIRLDNTLTRIDKSNLPNLNYVFGKKLAPAIHTVLLNLARASCELTGTTYYYHDSAQRLRTSPIIYKAKAISDLPKVYATLSIYLNKSMAYLRDDYSEGSSQLIDDAQKITQKKPMREKAVTTITRFWKYKRTFAQIENDTTVNVQAVSTPNLKRLKKALADGLNSPNEEIYLALEEKPLYQYLTKKFPWVLKHITPYYSEIYNNGNMLKSIDQRNREGFSDVADHSIDIEGRRDNVFFTIGGPNGWPAEFLQAVHGHEIRIPIRSFLDKSDRPIDNLKGLWLSSAWFCFLFEARLSSVIGTVQRTVEFVRSESKNPLLTQEDYKLYHYRDQDGGIRSVKHHLGQETVTGKELLPFLALTVLHELRYMDDDFRNRCLSHPAGAELEGFINIIFEQRNYEAYVPVCIDLSDSRIEVRLFNQAVNSTPAHVQAMKNAIENSDLVAIQNLLDAGVPIDLDLGQQLTPLGHAMTYQFDVNEAVACFLIDKGANTRVRVINTSPLTHCIAKHALQTAEKILAHGIREKNAPGLRRRINVNSDTDAIMLVFYRQDILALDLLTRYGLIPRLCSHELITHLASGSEIMALQFVDYLADHHFPFCSQTPDNQDYAYTALKLCILSNKYRLFKRLVEAGISPNVKPKDNQPDLLSIAKQHNQPFVDLLLDTGSNEFMDKQPLQTTNIVFIWNRQGELLVSKEKQSLGHISRQYSSLLVTGTTEREQIDRSILANAGINISDKTLTCIGEASVAEQTFRLFKIILDEKMKAIATMVRQNWCWVAPKDHQFYNLDTLSRCVISDVRGDDLMQQISRGERMLTHIRKANYRQALRDLTSSFIDVHQRALFYACDTNTPNLPLIKDLLDKGYDPNQIAQVESEWLTPLTLAITNQQVDVLDLLVRSGAQLNQALYRSKVTPLMLAASLNQVETMQFLIAAGADLDHPNNRPLLAYACMHNCSNAVFDFLVEVADCEAAFLKHTPLAICAVQQDKKRVDRLVQKGVNPYQIDPITGDFAINLLNGNEPLQHADKPLILDKLTWSRAKKQADFYLTLTGMYQHPEYEQKLSREYDIQLIERDDTSGLAYFYDLIADAQDTEQVRIAIAFQASTPVFVCHGFSKPVIAISKHYLETYSPSNAQIKFALLHELEIIQLMGNQRFSIPSLSDRAACDRAIFVHVPFKKECIEFLRQSIRFEEQTEFAKQQRFFWPSAVYGLGEYYRWHVYHHLCAERIKMAKIFWQSQSLTELNDSGDLPASLKKGLTALTAYNDYPDFPNTASQEDKFRYLMDKLPSLKAEFLPYDCSRQASGRLLQYSQLCRESELNDRQKDALLVQADASCVPAFQFLYYYLVSGSGSDYESEWMGIFEPMGPFKGLASYIARFIESRNSKEIAELASLIIKLEGRLRHHFIEPSQWQNQYNKLLSNHPAGQIESRYWSSVGRLTKWPYFDVLSDACTATHLDAAKKQGDGDIWRVLWMIGNRNNSKNYGALREKIYSVVPISVIDKLLRFKLKQGDMDAYPDWMPTCLINYRFDQGVDKFPHLYHYFLDKTKDDLPVKATDGVAITFADIQRYIDNNLLVLFQANHLPSITESRATLINLFERLYEQDPSSVSQIKQFFLADESNTQGVYQIKHLCNTQWSYTLQRPDPLYEFVISTPFFSPVEKLAFITKVITKRTFLNYDAIFDFFSKLHLKKDQLSTALTLTTLTNVHAESPALASNLLSEFLQQHPIKLFSQSGHDTVQFFYSKHDQSVLNIVSAMRHITKNWQDMERCGLATNQLIDIYLAVDNLNYFPDEETQKRFSQTLLIKIRATKSLDHRCQLIEKVLLNSFMSIQDKQFNRSLRILWANTTASILGLDDGSQRYYMTIKTIIDRVVTKASDLDADIMLSLLSKQVETQWRVSKYLSYQMEPEKNGNYKNSQLNCYKYLSETINNLCKTEENKQQTLDFFASPLSQESLRTYAEHIIETGNARIFKLTISKVQAPKLYMMLSALYRNFWDYRLEQRAALLDSVIISIEEEASIEKKEYAYQLGIDYLSNKLFPNSDKNVEDDRALEVLTHFLNTADVYQRQFLLAAMLATHQEMDEQHTSPGKKFLLLCEHMGPAFVKFAQLVHSSPHTPDSLKNDLDNIKGRAAPLPRWTLSRLIEDIIPPKLRSRLRRFGQLIGSASYNLAIEVTMDTGEERVLLLLREQAEYQAIKGCEHIKETVKRCSDTWLGDKKFTFIQMVNEAKAMSVAEIDHNIGDKQHQLAKQLYTNHKESVTIAGETFTVSFQACESIESGPGYRLLSKMPGVEFNDLKKDNTVHTVIIKAVARAVLAKELTILLSGGVFDSDRHGNQLRIQFSYDRFQYLQLRLFVPNRLIQLGLYDFGEMSLEPLSKDEINSFAALLTDLPMYLKENRNISYLFEHHIHQLQTQGRSHRHLMRINKALLALNDFRDVLDSNDVLDIIKENQAQIHTKLFHALCEGQRRIMTNQDYINWIGSGLSDIVQQAKDYFKLT